MAITKLVFATFISDIELPFYNSLASQKINHDRLDDSARRLLGVYEIRPSDTPEVSCRLQVLANALTADVVPSGFYRAEGIIKNFNTIEEYKSLDKTTFLNESGRNIWNAISNGSIFSSPSLLASFIIICFADLKKYKFTYQFAFPAFPSDPPWGVEPKRSLEPTSQGNIIDPDNYFHRISGSESIALIERVQKWRCMVDSKQHGFFLAKRMRGYVKDASKNYSENAKVISDSNTQPITLNSPNAIETTDWEIGLLQDYENGFFKETHIEDRLVCFADPSTYSNHPGWMLRNLLLLVRHRWKLDKVQVLCYRDIHARRHEAQSIILKVRLDDRSAVKDNLGQHTMVGGIPKVTGWERNQLGRPSSKVADLAEHFDPRRLADQAVDLNLRLIKWRVAPNLDLERIKATKCLLLGAGTLGCYVARALLGWGIRKITFVDNGSVSFSNPVRQPLFSFNDCLGGGVQKAHRASQALLDIFPGVESKGYVISVPMAGHPVTDEEKSKSEFEILKGLVEEHDAIILLMDTRESRWLPTIMGKAAGKIVMNAALGFDTFVVMRHGMPDREQNTQELGCYFCNDVVAPTDSTTDRTLDQQCTVTRPGVAAIASALLVEILVSLLQHPRGVLAPAPISQAAEYGNHPLGLVPHQIRGFLSRFQSIIVTGKSYDCCSACSDKVINVYRSQGWEFVKKALNEANYVEELSGLAEVQRIAERTLADTDWNDEDTTEEEYPELL